MKVIGMIQKQGEYQGRPYNNIMIHCIKSDDNALGEITEALKVKTADADSVMGKHMTENAWADLIGKEVEPLYNRFGKIVRIREVKSDE